MNESRGDFGAPKSNSISSLGSEATQLLNEEGLQNATDPDKLDVNRRRGFCGTTQRRRSLGFLLMLPQVEGTSKCRKQV